MTNLPPAKGTPAVGPLAARIAQRQQQGGFTRALGVLFGRTMEAAPPHEAPAGESEEERASPALGLNQGALLSRLQGTHRSQLNRGFYALLEAAGPPAPGEEHPEEVAASEYRVILADAGMVLPNPFLPPMVIDEGDLDLLAQSVRELGVLEPLQVMPTPEADADGRRCYWVILGERHRQAAARAGLTRLPVIVREVSPRAGLQMFLQQYVHTRPVSILVRAHIYHILTSQMGMMVDEVAERVGVPLEELETDLALLELEEPIQESLRRARLERAQASVLLKVPDRETRMALWQYAVRYGPTPERMEERLEAMRRSST